MSLSGSKLSTKRKGTTTQIEERMWRMGTQVVEVFALMTFLVGLGLNSLLAMGLGAGLAWAAMGVAYYNHQRDMAKRAPDKRDALGVSKISMYVSFTLAAALSLMLAFTLLG